MHRIHFNDVAYRRSTTPVAPGNSRHNRMVFIATVTSIAFMLFFMNPPASAAESDVPALAPQPWSDNGYGLSFRPPSPCLISETDNLDNTVRFVYESDTTISLFYRYSRQPMVLDEITERAIGEISFANPSAVILDNPFDSFKPADFHGEYIALKLTGKKDVDWILCQIYILIDDLTMAVLEIEYPASKHMQRGPLINDMLETVTLADQAELTFKRAQALEAGEVWRSTYDISRYHEILIPEQWLRIVEGQNDIGYARIEQQIAEELNRQGIYIEMQSRIAAGTEYADMKSSFFLSNDGTMEIWSIRHTRRPRQDDPINRSPNQPIVNPELSWAETGLRSGSEITVSRELPTGIREYKWMKPAAGYLNQVELFLMNALLPHESETTMSFYAYDPQYRSMALRHIRIVPREAGRYVVFTRPSPSRLEQAQICDPAGNLILWSMPGGRVWIPSTREQIAELWSVQ